jgi:AcrR family transcriptional regulator
VRAVAGKRRTPAAEKILRVASELFYEQGLAVGVDAIAEQAGVTKKTLYERFGSKNGLIVAYLENRDERFRARVHEHLEHAGGDPVKRLLAVFDGLGHWMETANTRGCAFVNALAELPAPDHPGRRVAQAEKTWLRELFTALATEAGASDPRQLANQLLTLHEGAIVTYSVAEDQDAAETAREAASALVTVALPASP